MSKVQRGFAKMDPAKQKAIASQGGKKAHEMGTAHKFDSTEGRDAGRKGGLAVSKDPEHMATIGRSGGKTRAANAAQKKATVAAASLLPAPDESSPETPKTPN